MDDWISGACDQVDTLVEKDPYFRVLDAQRRELEPFYLKILDNLSPTDREIIAQYEYLLSEIAYQKTQAAYRVGMSHRLRVLPKQAKP